jgi:hypothetical protein
MFGFSRTCRGDNLDDFMALCTAALDMPVTCLGVTKTRDDPQCFGPLGLSICLDLGSFCSEQELTGQR